MAGLLGQSPLAGLLAMIQQPQQAQQPVAADAGDMLLANRYEQRQAALPAIPQRGAPSPLGNAFRFLVGGQEGLAADRAARIAEANAPAMAEQQQRLRDLVAQMAPQAQLAYALNPEKFGESLSEQFRPQVIGKGGVQSVIGENRTVSAPGFEQRGKTLYREDPINGVEAVLDIAPTYGEETAQGRLALDADLGNRRINLDEQKLNQDDRQFDARLGLDREKFDRENSQLPDSVRKDNEKDFTAINDRASTISRVEGVIASIDSGLLDLDPQARASAWVRNNTNNSSPQSRAQAEARRTVESLRNQILNDATGPQTDGDSLRALNQILNGWGDEKVVREGLDEYLAIQRRKSETQAQLIQQRSRRNPSATPTVTSISAPIRVTSVAQARALPSGTRFIDPNGVERVVP